MSLRGGQVALVMGLLGPACTGQPPPQPPERPPRLVTPPARVDLHIGRVPLVVDLPGGLAAASASATLDGRSVALPGATLRERLGRTDLIAELDLTRVADGEHTLGVTVGDHVLSLPLQVARPPCAVSVHVLDADTTPVAARVSVRTPEGPVPLLADLAPDLDGSRREALLDSVFTTSDGRPVELWLDPGAYTLTAAGGLRSGVASTRVVCPDARSEHAVALTRSPYLDLPDAVVADLHVHTAASVDTWIPDGRRVRSLEAADLDFAVVSDHNVVRAPPAAARLRMVPGVEHSHQPGRVQVAHINAFPAVPDTPLPSRPGRSLARTLGALAELPEVQVVQLDHPRGVDLRHDPNRARVRPAPYRSGTTLLDTPIGYAVWSYPGLDRHQPLDAEHNRWLLETDPETGATALSFDVVEVLNRSSLSRYREVRADWFALLDQGIWRPATGNSDSHAATIEHPGLPANVVSLPAAEVSVDGLARALARGTHVVSNGPVPSVAVATVSGEQVGPGGLASVSGATTVRARVRAASRVPVQELRLVVNGDVVERVQLGVGGDPGGPAVDVSHTFSVHVEADSWLLVEVGWPLDAPPEAVDDLPAAWRWSAPGHVPLGFTNPVRLDADGDGVWRPEAALPAATLDRIERAR